MAIQPNLNSGMSASFAFTAQSGSSPGVSANTQQADISRTNFASVSSTLGFSQQMLAALVQLQASWRAIGTGLPIGDGSLNSLGIALSGQYAGMTFGSPGNASDLNSLQSPLRGLYGVSSDNLNFLGGPLRGAYQGMMQIPGMPPTPPVM